MDTNSETQEKKGKRLTRLSSEQRREERAKEKGRSPAETTTQKERVWINKIWIGDLSMEKEGSDDASFGAKRGDQEKNPKIVWWGKRSENITQRVKS
jgi:hypothetical protein